jgi:hypothetical protein
MLTVINYYKNNKPVVAKLFLMTLTVGILEAAGIFAIIPYVDIMFAEGDILVTVALATATAAAINGT